jgi:alpha-ribazole phosphatase
MLELLRHGDTGRSGFRGLLDDALSPLGWAQMESAIAGRCWQQLLCSPLQRCRHFAEALAQRWGVSLQVEEALREYDFGAWTGCTPADLYAEQPDALARFWADPDAHPPPGAERLVDFEARVLGALRRAHARHAGQQVLCITHGGVMCLLQCRQRGWARTRMSEIEVAHAALLQVQPVTLGAST